ncbi:MAG: proteasome ATPase [Actinomycetaceae bacterium]|nr:proteasome ATPase [Actinomycetaceae bacterium]
MADLAQENALLKEKNRRLGQALAVAREHLTVMQSAVEKISLPPSQIAIFIAAYPTEIEVALGSRRMRVAVGPNLDVATLSTGDQVRLSENMVAAEKLGRVRGGEICVVKEVIGTNRVLVAASSSERVLTLAGSLRHGGVAPGDTVMADLASGICFEKIVREDVEQLLTPQVPQTTYADIGGLDTQIEQIREAIELPFLHPQLHVALGLSAPKGVLLYGPPGNGKTLIAKAVANALGSGKTPAYFLSVKGPELLSKFVGETERQIRALFERARELSATGAPVVLFFDEMEALFRKRGSGISSDVETMIVPQFLAEMDGIESTGNVMVIGASNREDMIDPAVLRPGRLDVRIRIGHPSPAGAAEILRLHLKDVPLRENVGDIVDQTIALVFERSAPMRLFTAVIAGSPKEVYLADIISGAMLAGIVEDAKRLALKDHLRGYPLELSAAHLRRALQKLVSTSRDLAVAAGTDEWAGGQAIEKIIPES